jgi:outer membrane protein TolC
VGFHSLKSQQKSGMTADECVAFAVKNNVQVKNALLAIQIQQQSNKELTATAYPHIGASASSNYFPNVATQVFPNFIAMATYGVLNQEGVKDGNGNKIVMPSDFGYVQAQFGTKYNSSLGADFSQLLFDGQVFVGLQARSTVIKMMERSAEVTVENIKANVLKVYYQIVAGRKQLDALDANIELISKLAHNTNELIKNGFAEKLDLDKVNVTLNNLKTERIKIGNQLELGLQGLKLLMGMPVKDELFLSETLDEKNLELMLIEGSYNVDDRKEIQQIELARRLGEYNVRRYQLAKLPSLAMFGQLSTSAQQNVYKPFDQGQKWYPSSLIGLKLSVTLFDGLARNARIQKARYELKQTENSLEQFKMAIDNEVAQAKSRYETSLMTLSNQKGNSALAQKVYNTTVKKYESGLGSNLEVTNAQTDLRVALSNYYGSLYDAIMAKYDYLKATGKL